MFCTLFLETSLAHNMCNGISEGAFALMLFYWTIFLFPKNVIVLHCLTRAQQIGGRTFFNSWVNFVLGIKTIA